MLSAIRDAIRARRTVIQVALFVIGILVWGYGQRDDDERLEYIGIGFFAAATIMRAFKYRQSDSAEG